MTFEEHMNKKKTKRRDAKITTKERNIEKLYAKRNQLLSKYGKWFYKISVLFHAIKEIP